MGHVVVVGAGQAGSSCVAKLRNSGFEGQITLIGEEPVPPYQRPPLSKAYLLGDMALERMFLRPETFYSENNIELRMSTRVDAINASEQNILIGDETLHYDDLVLTTGSVPNRLPASIGGALDGVFVARDLADVDAMASRFVKGAKVLIVGGGYIGLEAASVASSLACRLRWLRWLNVFCNALRPQKPVTTFANCTAVMVLICAKVLGLIVCGVKMLSKVRV